MQYVMPHIVNPASYALEFSHAFSKCRRLIIFYIFLGWRS